MDDTKKTLSLKSTETERPTSPLSKDELDRLYYATNMMRLLGLITDDEANRVFESYPRIETNATA